MSKKQPSKGKDNGSSPLKSKLPACQHSVEQAQAAKQAAERQKIHQYLRGLEVTSFTEQLAKGITRTSADRVTQGLRSGLIEIAPNPLPLPEKVTPPPKLTNEEARQLENKAKREAIVKKMEYLYEQIRGEGKQGQRQGGKEDKAGNLQVQFKEILTKQQHERRMRQIVQQKQERKRRMQELQAEQARRRQQEEQKQQAMKKLQQEKEKEMKRQKIQQNLKRRKEQHEKQLEVSAKLQRQLETAKSKSKLYEQMEQRYKSQVLLPSLQEKKLKLKEIRDFHKRYDLQSIKDHQKQYLQRSLQKSREKRANSPEWKYQPPSHTERLSRLLKEEQAMIKEQLQARRKKLEEMQKRQEIFRQEMKEKHQPVVDDQKRREIEERIIRERMKYEKMHPDIDKRKLGEAYMEIAKKMKRPQSVKQPQDEESKLLKKEESKSLLRGNHTQQFYEQLRRKKIDNIIKSDEKAVSEKYQMLKMEADKLGEKLKQKEQLARLKGDPEAKDEAAELLLSSIKAKMGIVDLLKNNTRTHSQQAV